MVNSAVVPACDSSCPSVVVACCVSKDFNGGFCIEISSIRPGLRRDSIGDRPVPLLHLEMGQGPRVWRNRATSELVLGFHNSSHRIGANNRSNPIHRTPRQQQQLQPPPPIHLPMHGPQHVRF
ncbi:unnamed protein product, partial [Mesorhabditis belari]|uniref:Uncharacterized protein n=1 Tax=Mesorhabditis belari TaxID=2138241 RepID=A0AAF3F8E5_9BILA